MVQPSGKPAQTSAAPIALESTSFAALKGWQDDQQQEAMIAFLRSCEAWHKQPAEKVISVEKRQFAVGAMQERCKEAEKLPSDATVSRRFFEERFRPWRVKAGSKPTGLFTGYYEPLVEAALTKSDVYHVPLYPVPSDMLTADLEAFNSEWKGKKLTGRVEGTKIVPYHDRQAIDSGALDKVVPLAWAKDAVEVFFLQIQGSGIVALPNGTQRRIGYAGQNGKAYVAIGAKLLEQGAITKEDMSAQAIKSWLRAQPDQANALMWENPSYVFFRWLEGQEGPIGAQGVPLTPERSLAVDRSQLPLGLPLWLETQMPVDHQKEGERLQRLMVAQDTGGAIKGAVRGDIFWGAGEKAAYRAGHQRFEGEYTLLLPEDGDAPAAAR